jgi:hypothetical protein
MEIIKSLKNSPIISQFEIIDFKTFKTGFYIKIKAIVIDKSELFIREYSDDMERNYSFHWQDTEGNLKYRWDNSPHHKEINTYPNHKHIKNKIEPSGEITIDDILPVIKKIIS